MLNCSSGYFNGSLSVDDCIACVPNDDVTFGFNYYLFLMCLGGTMFLCLVLLAVNRARSGEWSLGILRFTLRSSLAIGYFILWGTIPYLYRRTNGPGYISGFDYNDFVICGTPSVCTSFIADKMGSTFLSASTIVATMSALLRAVMGYRFTRWNASKWGYRASVVLDAGFSVQYAPLLVLNDGNFGCFSNPMWQGNPSTSFVFLALCLLYIGAILSDIRVAQQAPPVGMLAMGGIMMLYGTGYLVARLAMAPNGSDVARTLLFIAPSFVLTAMVNAMALAARCKSLWTVDEQTAKRRLVPYGLGDPYVDELSHFGSSLVRLVRENNCRTLTTSTEWTETLVEAGKVLTVHWSNRSNANHSGFAWGHDDTNVCDHDAFGQPDITALAGYCARQRLPATAGPAAGTTQLQFSILNAFFAPVEHAGFSSTMMTLWRSGRQNTVCSRVWDAPEFEPTRVLTKGFLDLVGAFPTVEPVPPPTAAYAATRRASGVPRTPDEITATRSTRSTTIAAHVTPKGVEVRFARLMIGDPHTHVALRQYSRECAAIRWNCMVEVVAVDSAAFMELLEWPGAALIVTVPAWAVRKVEIANGFKFVVLPETSFEIMDVEVPTTAPRVDGEDSEPDVDPLTDDLLGDQASPPLALGDVHVPATHSPRGSASSARSDNLNPHRTLPLIVISHLQLTFDPWLVSDADL